MKIILIKVKVLEKPIAEPLITWDRDT